MRETILRRAFRGAAVPVTCLIVTLTAPALAGAYSFGTFAPGETVQQIELSPTAGDAFTYTDTNGQAVLNVSVSQIQTDLALYTPTLGDVILSVTLGIVPGSLGIFTTGGVFPRDTITADFTGGIVAADLALTDLGPGGAGTLLEGSLNGISDFDALQAFGTRSGSLAGSFDLNLAAGDAAFVTAVGDQVSILVNLTQFAPIGGAPYADLCQITDFNTCGIFAPPNGLKNFDAQPNGSITPILAPEPATAILLGLGLAGMALRRRGAPR